MIPVKTWRVSWGICLAAVIAAGILSRMVHTGSVLFDKYLGDALYAAMIYVIVRRWGTARAAALRAITVMIGIELFQLTMIAARMLESEHLIVRIIARLMGTHFSFLDLLAYVLAISCMYVADSAAS